MKRKILSLLLSFTLCLTLLPMAAFAEEPDKISITTVDELLQFAKAVDNGEYDDKTDAVVSLDADLDLTGVAWKPIGSVFDGDGNLLHYFSGKFYGNGHTISNLDFSENYGMAEYPVFGFFSVAYGAEISGLTIQGKLDVSNSGYVFFGTVAGVAENSKISDCVSDVSFTDTDKYINGPAALCGYAINSTIEHCQNKGNFSVTTDTTSLQMGGIVGVADNSTVQYCANTGDMTSWTPHTGGIVGQLYQGSKIINCYSTGKLVPLGHGTTNFGGIAGTVGAGTEIRHYYFAGEMDLSQYTATTPYKRLGGIAGGVSSDTPVFENNYFMETENVPACFKYQDAGTEETLDFMKTEDFFNEITTAGGNYRLNSNGTPILPAPKYAVSFVVTPAELTNVIIKVNGQVVPNPANLEAGTYPVEVSADNCKVFNSNITITADTATHTQTIAMTYLPADYTKVDAAIAKANALNKDNYKNFSAVEDAVNAVVRGKNITEQDEVDAMAQAIEKAINDLVRRSSGGSSSPSYSVTIPNKTENGTVTVNPKSASKGSTVTITAKPDSGYQLDDLTVTDKNGKELKLTDKGNGKYTFTMPASKVTVTPIFVKIAQQPTGKTFVDVAKSDWFADAVAYVTDKGLMNGTGSDTFSPNASTTRGMLMTVLARYAGEDTTGGSPWYQKGMNWAKAKGVSDGTNPEVNITREQLVTMLYRYAGSPKANGSLDSFSDAASVSSYAVNAMQWAVANGIVNGSNGKLNPKNNATRAEVAAIFMRFCEMSK